ncbi:MAG: GGDEF domain-containing response regulator [Myxococcota bacterium]
MQPNELNVLLVEDNHIEARMFKDMWSDGNIHHVWSLCEALEWLGGSDVDVIVLDMRLPDGFGVPLLQSILQRSPTTPVVVLTGESNRALASKALRSGAQDYIHKEDYLDGQYAIRRRISYAVERHQALLNANPIITHLKDTNSDLKARVMIDPLTQLLNRRGLERELNHNRRSQPALKGPHTALLIDVDDFKHFNDDHGHHIGDLVLEGVAHALGHNTRNSDIVARVGGDEFVAILTSTPIKAAQTVAQRALDAVSAITIEHSSGTKPIGVTVSIGLAELSSLELSIQDLLAVTHDALARSKAEGKNCVSS